jgi:nucleoside-diphosphate kinase
MAENTERTFIMIKPDGVQRGIVGDILRRFEQRGYKLVALKMIQVSFNKTYIGKKIIFFLS